MNFEAERNRIVAKYERLAKQSPNKVIGLLKRELEELKRLKLKYRGIAKNNDKRVWNR